MKIGVFGAGAVGCYLGGRLLAGGHDVVLVARPRVTEEIAKHGLCLVGLDGAPEHLSPTRVRCAADATSLADRDVVLVCVKSGQTEEAGRALASLPTTVVVVSMQNGVRNADVLRACMPSHRVLGGIVGFNVVAQGEGIFRQGTSGLLVVEDDGSLASKAVGNALAGPNVGLDVEVSRDIRGMQWSKLVMNLNNAVVALGDVSVPTILLDPGYRRVVRAIVREALEVLDAAGIRLARLGPLPIKAIAAVLGLPSPVVRLVAGAQLKMDPSARSSMWQDLTRGRLTEVEELNGEIVRLAGHHGRRAPVNEGVVRLVHEAERAASGSPKLSAGDLGRRLGLE